MTAKAKIISLILSLALLLGTAAALTACGETEPEETVCTSHSDGDGDGVCDSEGCGEQVEAEVPERVTYSITVTTAGGLPISGADVNLYDGGTLVAHKRTNASGVASFERNRKDTYSATVEELPDGYVAAASYPISELDTKITLETELLGAGHDGVRYYLGDVMHDFTLTDSNGNEITLSALLEEKRAVVINAWYVSCTFCKQEFPYMQEAYGQYSDEVEIVALNIESGDTNEEINECFSSLGLTFPAAKDTEGLSAAFHFTAAPTTVIIDRYGVITLIEEGPVTDTQTWCDAFEYLTSDGYVQRLFDSMEEISEQ